MYYLGFVIIYFVKNLVLQIELPDPTNQRAYKQKNLNMKLCEKHHKTKTCIIKSKKVQGEGKDITTNVTDPTVENET